MSNVDRILAEAMNLSDAERAELVARLGGTAPDPLVDAEWRSEMQRRRARLSSGSAKAESWEQVEAELMEL